VEISSLERGGGGRESDIWTGEEGGAVIGADKPLLLTYGDG